MLSKATIVALHQVAQRARSVQRRAAVAAFGASTGGGLKNRADRGDANQSARCARAVRPPRRSKRQLESDDSSSVERIRSWSRLATIGGHRLPSQRLAICGCVCADLWFVKVPTSLAP